MEDDEDECDEAAAANLDDAVMVSVEEKSVTPKVEEDDIDPALAEWLKIDEKKPAAPTYVNDDSATEADSDNADVIEPGEDPVDLDDWFQVKQPDEGAASESINLPEKVWVITIALLIALRSCHRMLVTQGWEKRRTQCIMTRS